MRELLFKAKTKIIAGTYNFGVEDGVWVEGLPCEKAGKWMIRQFERDGGGYADYVGYEVDPETICQYTGEKDKNGEKIFEGNIVKGAGDIGVVIYSGGRFEIDWQDSFDLRTDLEYWCATGRIEIAGNIYDNPELAPNAEVGRDESKAKGDDLPALEL